MSYVNRFVENTEALGVVGLLFFLITSVLILAGIQGTFNAVWGARSSKNSLRQMATYASVLIVGSFLLSLGLNLTSALQSVVSTAVEEISSSFTFMLQLLRAILVFIALFLMVEFLPAGRVSVRSALIGALVGALLWEVARIVFVYWVTYVIRLSIVYGSLAVIPIFLFWLYLAWAIVLLSLEIAYVHQHWGYLGRQENGGGSSLANRFLLGLEVYFAIARSYRDGKKPPNPEKLAIVLSASLRGVRFYTDMFLDRGLLIPAGNDGRGLVPARSLDRITVAEIVQTVFGQVLPEAAPDDKALSVYARFTSGGSSAVRSLTVKDHLEHDTGPETRTEAPESTITPAAAGFFRVIGKNLRAMYGKSKDNPEDK